MPSGSSLECEHECWVRTGCVLLCCCRQNYGVHSLELGSQTVQAEAPTLFITPLRRAAGSNGIVKQ